ncbi:MAG: cation:proton antiporter regulatory subunit [Planctomycetota bacterium]|jgi:K+/H+ antiporter YhaU regulatory subunit KhtT
MSVMLFIVVLVASFIIVRMGAIAFQLTGLEWSLAKFQALSCFSGTGFTTKEAELITGNPQRRRIATILIILGNAGLVTMIASVASALTPQQGLWARLSESFLPFSIPRELVPWINLVIIVVAVYVAYRVFTHERLVKKLTNSLRRTIIKKHILRPVSFEELLLVTAGYGVSRVEIAQDNPLCDKTLAESGLRSHDITVLAVIRADQTIANPQAGFQICPGDELVCFGRLDNIRDKTYLAKDS